MNEDVWILLNMGIFQPVMLVFGGVSSWWKMATFKGKWLGKYSRPMEHLGMVNWLHVFTTFGRWFRWFSR